MTTATHQRQQMKQEHAPADLPKMFTPLRLSIGWLTFTFVAFLTLGQVGEVPDLTELTLFVTATMAALALGYWLSIKSRVKHLPRLIAEGRDPDFHAVRRVTLASAIYVALYGLSLLVEYGATSPASVISAVLHPGQAYFAKFQIYEQQSIDASNPVIQVLTLASVLYTPLMPYTIIFWKRLTPLIRVASIVGVTLYASFFLFIGTMKGLGDLLIFAVAAMLVAQAGGSKNGRRKRSRRTIVAGVLLLGTFVGYMAFNQSERVTTVGISDRFAPNPVVKSLTNDEFARGVSVVAFYPTHGYLGLSKNLETPFEWAEMRGGSRALDSYLAQYGFGSSVSDLTYPARTESRTGWPAGMYWATAYPWLASDLTFPGTVLFMGVVGWWMARFWVEAVAKRSQLALLLLVQTMLFIAFIPANNQIGVSRPALIGFSTLLGLYALNWATSPFARKSRPRRTGR